MTLTMTNSQGCPKRRDSPMHRIVRFACGRTGNQTGQALVELSLTLPILFLLLMGAAEFGTLAYSAIEVANAARAGVAYGAQSHVTAADSTGMVTGRPTTAQIFSI